MSLGDAERRRLREAVQDARKALTAELSKVLEGTYGLHADGRQEALSSLPELQNDARLRETRDLLERMLPPEPKPTKAAQKLYRERFDALVRSLSFTHLNRLVAFKMLEVRKVLKETVGRHHKSRGYLFWLADRAELQAPGREAEAYELFLIERCRELNEEIGVLFDPEDLASRVFPGDKVIGEVLTLINHAELDEVWEQDEALGWTYQYYTPKKLRDDTRDEAKSGPRNSHELAFLNQFYTPHYVVRFLTENTLGRLWLEMKPDSTVRDACDMLLVRPEEQLPPRPKKDPRGIRVLDPACGSGHFLLYAFDLLADHIYPEAWDDSELGATLHEDFGTVERFTAEIPRLIVEENLHGVDIDRRATQIATLALLLKAKGRNKDVEIRKSGIVCAEPLPNDPAFLAAFKADKLGGQAGTLGRIFDGLVERLSLAGEAGTLLRVERIVDDLVDEERARFETRRRTVGLMKQEALLPEMRDPQSEFESFSDVMGTGETTKEASFREMGRTLERLLREYAAEAEGAEGAQRRLLARDSTGVLRFIDAMGEPYDVVLMNPPFGQTTVRSKKLIEAGYPASKNDLSTCFVERGVDLAPEGFVGVLATEAGFFRRNHEAWRQKVLLERTHMEAFGHLGGHVLDDATVRVAMFALSVGGAEADRQASFIRVFGKEDREVRLAEALREERAAEPSSDVYRVAQSELQVFPYAVFGYWCGEAIRQTFREEPSLEPSVGEVRVGCQTGNDPRYVRLLWEVPQATDAKQRWVPFAKGGEYSPFWDSVHLSIHWDDEAMSLRGFCGRPGRTNPVPASAEYYFRPGLTYPRRTNKRFAPRLMPAGCAFADKGPAVFVQDDAPRVLHSLCGTLNSRVFSYLLSFGIGTAEAEGGAGANSYEVGLVQRMPLPSAIVDDADLARESAQAAALRRRPDFRDETTAAFVLPFEAPKNTLDEMVFDIVQVRDGDVATFARLKASIEDRVCNHYGFGPAERAEIEQHVGPMHTLDPFDQQATRVELAKRIVCWAVGVVVGRFDIRLATGERGVPEATDPFAQLPARSPGMLQSDGVPDGYPISVDSDGILVDDEGHDDDIVRRVRDVLALVWKDPAEALEKDLCEALGVKKLRDYFRKPTGFFTHTIDRYSKSKRRAPIYWLLRSGSGGYGVWVYYHRLDKDTLYKVLHDRYLLGRIQRCRQAIAELEPADGEKRSRADDKRRESAEGLLAELEQFKTDLEAVVQLRNERGAIAGYDPDLNAGVVITAAPLYKVIPWPTGKKPRPDVIWQEVLDGKYDWARIAMRLFPDRVRAKCEKDPSLAIAHGLDAELFPDLRERLTNDGAKKKKRKKKG